MATVRDIDDFLARITARLADDTAREFVVLEDEAGVEIAELTPGALAPHELVAELVRGGALGAAYLNYLASRGEVIAQVLVGRPERSDLR